APGIPRMRLLLDERPLIPDELVAPPPACRRGMPVHHREVYAFWLVAPELIFEPALRVGAERKQHETGGVAVDPMHHERLSLAVRAQEGAELVQHARRCASAVERYRQQSRRLVDDDQRVVFVDDLRFAA